MVNHWWQVSLRLTARGLTTTAMPVDQRVLDVELDLIDHRLVARTSDGGVESMSLCDQPLSTFYADYMRLLGKLGVRVAISPMAVEIPDRVLLDQDARLCRYDGDWANRFFRALLQADRLLKEFRGRFRGRPARSTSSGGRAIWRRRASRGAPPRCTPAGSRTSATR